MPEDKSRPSTGPEKSVRDLRNALGGFVTGVTVVTTEIDGERCGFTANSFCSVSLDPPLVLVCIGKTSSNFSKFQEADHFCINVLAEAQRDVSQQFATSGVDRFEGIACETGALGSPVIPDSLSWFECAMHDRFDAGDHEILVGRVEDYGYGTQSPLAYFRGNYVLFELEKQIAGYPKHGGNFGVILEGPGGVILEETASDGMLKLPSAPKLGTPEAKDGLYGHLMSLGIEFGIEFVFAVWEEDNADGFSVYCRGTASNTPETDRLKTFQVDEIPYDRLGPYEARLLTRYAEEHASQNFTIYSGTSTKGDWLHPGERAGTA